MSDIQNIFGADKAIIDAKQGKVNDFVTFLNRGVENKNKVSVQKGYYYSEVFIYSEKTPGISNYKKTLTDCGPHGDWTKIEQTFDFDHYAYMDEFFNDYLFATRSIIHAFDKVTEYNCDITPE